MKRDKKFKNIEEEIKDSSQPWEIEMMSPDERLNRVAELLSRGVLRLMKEEKNPETLY